MKKSSFIYLLLFFAFCLSFCKTVVKTTFPNQQKVKQAMDKAMESNDLPAVIAIGIHQNGEEIKYTYGKAVWEEVAPVTTNHIFRIYSMTKLVTSLAALQLVEKNQIGLDDDLSTVLPEMTQIPILTNGKLIEGRNPVTLRHLLTHTAGFGYPFTDEALSKFDKTDWAYEDLPRRFESGTQFLYGTNTDWVGKLVEKLSGLSLEDYFRKNITGPLDMHRTWFNVPDSLKTLIVSHGMRGPDGQQVLAALPDRIPQKATKTYSGGGGLFSTPADYTKLLACLLKDGQYEGGQLLKKQTIDELFNNQIGTVDMDISDNYFRPELCCNFDGLIKKSAKWSLGGLLDTAPTDYGRQSGTLMWGGAMNTFFYIDRKSGIAASIYTQHFPFNHAATTELFDTFSALIYERK